MINSKRKIHGGQVSIDHRAFAFDDSLNMPVTLREQRLENYPAIGNLTSNPLVLDFNVNAVSDFSMYDLKNSYFIFSIVVPNLGAGNNTGLAQFAAESLITDCIVKFGSVVVSESHPSTYGYSAFAKDILTRKRPAVPTTVSTINVGGTLNTTYGGSESTEDLLECGLYLSNAMQNLAVIDNAGGNSGSYPAIAYTQQYMNNTTIQVKVELKDSVFMTSKFFPANMTLSIRLIASLGNLLQSNPAAGATNLILQSAQFYLNRVFLSQESMQAQSMALARHPFKYVLPYARIEQKQINAGSSNVSYSSLFAGMTKPDLVVVYFVPTMSAGLTKGTPQFICGAGVYGGVNAGGYAGCQAPVVSSLYMKYNNIQYPRETAPTLASNDIRTYNEYVKQCLHDNEDVYLDYLHWCNHYTTYVINLRPDQEKFYGVESSEESGNIELIANFSNCPNACTMYAVALNHVRLYIDEKSIISKVGYSN